MKDGHCSVLGMALISLVKVVAGEESNWLAFDSLLASVLYRIFDIKCINTLWDTVQLVVRRKLDIEADRLGSERYRLLLSFPWNLFEQLSLLEMSCI